MGSSDGEAVTAPPPSQNGGSRSECRQSAGQVVPSEPHGVCKRTTRSRRERSLDSVALIGQGSDALVYLVRSKLTGRMSALKVQRKADHERSVERVHMEREVMVDARHPLVAPLHAAFQDRLYLYLEMEYCPGGSLDNFLRHYVKRNLTEDEARFYAAEITLGLEFLHSKGYVYRDLKAANVLVAASGHIKLTDFGIAERGKLRIETDDRMWKGEVSPPRPLPRVQSSPGLAKPSAPCTPQQQRLDSGSKKAVGSGGGGSLSAGVVGFSSVHGGHRPRNSHPGGGIGTPPLGATPGLHRRASTSACVTSSSSSIPPPSLPPASGSPPPRESSSSSSGGGGSSYSAFFRRKQKQKQEQQQLSPPMVEGTPPRPPPSLGFGRRMRGRFSRGSRGSKAPNYSPSSDTSSPSLSPEGAGAGAGASAAAAAAGPMWSGIGGMPPTSSSGSRSDLLSRNGGQGQGIGSRSPPSPTSRIGGHAATRRATVTLGEASWGLLSGSPEYMAPEVLMHDPQGSAVDWWGLGVLTYELLLGRTPFAGENGKTRFTFLNIMHKEACFPEPGEREEGDISAVCQRFVRALLSKDPRGRAGSASPVREHPFFSGVRWDRLLREEPPLRVPGLRSDGGNDDPAAAVVAGTEEEEEEEVMARRRPPPPVVENTSGWWWEPEDGIAAEAEEEGGEREKDWWPFDRFDWSDGGRDCSDASCVVGPVPS